MSVDTLQNVGIPLRSEQIEGAKEKHGMSLLNTVAVAWEGVMLNKLRSFLTILGVIIGVAAVIVMLSVSAGAEAEIADQINTLGANLIMVTPVRSFGGVQGAGGRPGGGNSGSQFQYEDAAAIASNVEGISGVAVEQNTTQDVKAAGVTLTGISIVGTTADLPLVRDYTVGDGRFFTAEENDGARRVAVIGYAIAQDLFPSGDAVGQQIRIASTNFTIIGVMAEQGVVGNTDNDSRIYIPVTVVFKKFSSSRFGGDQVRMILVKAESEETMAAAMVGITTLIAGRRSVDPAEPDFGVRTQQDIVDARASTTETFRNLLAWVAGISLLVGGIGVMNIMLVSVTERTREIGLRQSLGARPRDVRLQFLFEAIMLSLIGGLVGVILGVLGIYAFGALGDMRTELVPVSLPLAFLASASVGIFFGYYPASQAAQLDPIEALRRE